MAINTGSRWKTHSLAVKGYGSAAYGQSPYGAKASAFHLGSTSFAAITDPASTGSTWKTNSLAVKGYGAATWGSSPYGAKASAYNLGSTAFTPIPASDG